MERRNSRPYLQQYGTDSIDKFLKNINLTSNNYNDKTLSRFPTNGLEGNSKYSSYSNSFGKYPPLYTTSNSSTSTNYSSHFPATERSRSGIRAPLYNLSKNSTYKPKNHCSEEDSRYAQRGCNEYAGQRTGTIPTVRDGGDGGKKHKSALKSLRSFFKRHLIGEGRTRRDLSAAPLNTRFSSTQHVNGHHSSYKVPITHRRSSSSSVGFINDNRHQPSSPAFNSIRDPIVKRSSTVLPFNNLPPSTSNLLNSARQGVQKKTREMSSEFQEGEHDNLSVWHILQHRPVTPDDISPTKLSPRHSLIGTPCLKGLANHGNTCYFSAIIQCLAVCESFAEFLLCDTSNNKFGDKFKDSDCLSMPFIDTFRCLWFNNTSADTFCLKTLKFIEKVYPQFVISCQQDSHECLIWLLNTLHEETKVSDKRTNDNKLDLKLRMYKSEEELASDALEQISGSHESTITDLGQFRSALKCANPMCGFTNLTFEPYLCVSLSVPLETKQCNFSVILISLIPSPVITRYYFAIPGSVIAVSYFKNLIMETLFEPSNDLIACSISPSGQIKLFSNDCIIDVANRHFNELNILEIPRISSGIQQDDVIVAIVVFTLGIFPYGERLEHPFTANLLKNWNYEFISNHLLDKGSHILPFSFCPLPQDYKILVQNSEYKVLVLDPQLIKPLNDYIICEKYNNKNVLRIVVEWDIKLRGVFMSSLVPAVVHNNYSFCGSENLDYVSKQSAISLTNLIDDYVKCESIRDWVCPKCKKSSGSMELQFHSLPDVLVFHLKRFESLSVGVTKKIDSRVQIPIEELDMSPYVFNQHLRSSTLPRNKRNGNVNKFNYIEKNSLIYYLTGVIYHYGERTNSGHYTAATRNPVDGKWRTFDDSRVSLIAESGYSFNELHNSSRSYLLFYQRRPYVKRQLTWFPQNVPEHIIQKYQRRFDCDDTDKSYTNGKSIFYKM